MDDLWIDLTFMVICMAYGAFACNTYHFLSQNKLSGSESDRGDNYIKYPIPKDVNTFPDKIEIGKKYCLSFYELEGQRHRGFEVVEIVGFEEAFDDPEYYPIVKERNGKAYSTNRLRIRKLEFEHKHKTP